MDNKLKIREAFGYYALDIPNYDGSSFTLHFNSKKSAENVKHIIEIDGNKPNEATAADVREVRHAKWYKVHEHIILADGSVKEWDNFFCSNCEEVSNCPTKYCPCCGAKIDKEENND